MKLLLDYLLIMQNYNDIKKKNAVDNIIVLKAKRKTMRNNKIHIIWSKCF